MFGIEIHQRWLAGLLLLLTLIALIPVRRLPFSRKLLVATAFYLILGTYNQLIGFIHPIFIGLLSLVAGGLSFIRGETPDDLHVGHIRSFALVLLACTISEMVGKVQPYGYAVAGLAGIAALSIILTCQSWNRGAARYSSAPRVTLVAACIGATCFAVSAMQSLPQASARRFFGQSMAYRAAEVTTKVSSTSNESPQILPKRSGATASSSSGASQVLARLEGNLGTGGWSWKGRSLRTSGGIPLLIPEAGYPGKVAMILDEFGDSTVLTVSEGKEELSRSFRQVVRVLAHPEGGFLWHVQHEGKYYLMLGSDKSGPFDEVRQIISLGHHLAWIAVRDGKYYLGVDLEAGRPYDGIDRVRVSNSGTVLNALVRLGDLWYPLTRSQHSEVLDECGLEEISILVASDSGRSHACAGRTDGRWIVTINGKSFPEYDRVSALAISPNGQYVLYAGEEDGGNGDEYFPDVIYNNEFTLQRLKFPPGRMCTRRWLETGDMWRSDFGSRAKIGWGEISSTGSTA